MAGHTNLYERVRGKAFLGSIAARLGNVRPSEDEAGLTESEDRTNGVGRLPKSQATRRSAARSSMDAGITGGLTLFGMRRNGR